MVRADSVDFESEEIEVDRDNKMTCFAILLENL